MHYQHRFHAGNFADVFKHVLLCALLRALNAKDKPWCFLESHAGAGRYDLADEAAGRTAEFRDGVARLVGLASPPEPLATYLRLVAAENPGEPLRHYPGSPALALALARAHDRLILCEKKPAVAEQLRLALGSDARVVLHQRDGYEAGALLPPKEKRGLVLVDPPFERADEFEAMADFVLASLARFSNGVYALWYPYKNRHESDRFLRRMQRDCSREMLNCLIDTDAPAEGQMRACGLLVINPPFQFIGEAQAAMPLLADLLGQGPRPRAQAECWAARPARDPAP